MAIFAILRSDSAASNDALSALIAERYPNDFYRVTPGQWLISASETTRSISERLDIVKGSPGRSTLVVAISSYYGVHTTELWDWIRSKLEGGSRG